MHITKIHADCCLYLIKKTICKDAKLIGSFGKGADYSDHDIDILLPNVEATQELNDKIAELLEAKRVDNTDWDGWYFYDTFYGDVDIFFNIDGFDY